MVAPSDSRREEADLARADLDIVETFWEHAGDETPEQSAAASARLTARLYQLASTKFISNLDAASFAELYAKIEWSYLRAGETLFTAGDSADDGMFIVIRGSMGVYRTLPSGSVATAASASEHLISQFVRGESFCEFALLTGERRFFTCRAIAECQVFTRGSRGCLVSPFVLPNHNSSFLA